MKTCVTVSYGLVKGRAKQYTYYQPATYAEYTTQDGRTVWKYVDHILTARRSLKLALHDAKAYAEKYKIPFIMGVRNWQNIV